MEVIITKKARDDLHDFFNNSRTNTENYVINYINELLNCVDLISLSPHIGKIIDYIRFYKIRQLIHRKHKIFYTIYNNKIYILRFIHSSRNFNLKKDLNLLNFPRL